MQVCTSLQTDTPPPRHSVYYRPSGQMPFLLPNQQRQCTEGRKWQLNEVVLVCINFNGFANIPPLLLLLVSWVIPGFCSVPKKEHLWLIEEFLQAGYFLSVAGWHLVRQCNCKAWRLLVSKLHHRVSL